LKISISTHKNRSLRYPWNFWYLRDRTTCGTINHRIWAFFNSRISAFVVVGSYLAVFGNSRSLNLSSPLIDRLDYTVS